MLASFITIDPGPGTVVPCTYDNTIIYLHMISQVMNKDHGRFLTSLSIFIMPSVVISTCKPILM